MKLKLYFAALFCAAAVLLFSCATPTDYERVDEVTESSGFEGGIAEIAAGQERKKPRYPETNAVALYLDKGVLEHYAKRYADSSRDLQEAERLIEEAYTKSVTAEVTTYLVNDTVQVYGGEDYEDAYINVFNALNYYHAGNSEGALVEMRRMNEKLEAVAQKYEAQSGKLTAYVKETVNDFVVQNDTTTFSNSALARYLGMLFYRGAGKMDDARIDGQEIQKAFEAAPAVYAHSLPKSVTFAGNVCPETSIPAGKARLNVVGFAGRSPVKQSKVVEFSLPIPDSDITVGGLYVIKLATPKMVERPAGIDRILVTVEGGENVELELLEDMGRVMEETFKAKVGLIYLKAAARTTLKFFAANMAAKQAEKKNVYLGQAAKIAMNMILNSYEVADTRMGRFFPDKAYVGGINLDPGTYDVTVHYYHGAALVKTEKLSKVEVKAGALNLIETVGLK